VTVTPLPDSIGIGDLSPSGGPRSAGLHLSAIIKALMKELEPERFGKPLDALRAETGFAFERALEAGFKTKFPAIYRPMELQCDGVAMSPDGLDASDGVLEEFKCTWMSSRDCPLDKRFVHWLWQIKGYLHALGTNRARLRVFFVNGDYKQSGPQLLTYQLDFDDRELAENWAMLVNYAKAKGMLP